MSRDRTPEKRQRILDAALRVFAERGFYTAKVSEVAREAGVADGTIYLYFENKDDLLISLFEDRMDYLIRRLNDDLGATGGSVAQRVRRLIRMHLQIAAESPELAEFITVELRQSQKFIKEYGNPRFQEYLKILKDLIEEGQADGTLRSDLDPRTIVRAIFGALDELLLTMTLAAKKGRVPDLERPANDLADLFLNGMLVRQRQQEDAMKVLCTVRRVVDPESKPKIGAGGSLDLGAVGYKLNPFDEYGVEEAIRLKEKGQADEIVIVCVGNDECDKEIRSALAMGASRAIRVNVEDDTQLDTLTVAKLLAAVVEKESPDLVLMGKLSVDTEGNQVGQMLAEYLGWGQGTFAFKLDIDGGNAVVGREVDGGAITVKLALPAIVTADLRLNEPRYASLPGIMQAKKKPLEVIDADDLDIDLDAKVTTLGYELPPARAAGVKVGSVEELVAKLRDEAKVL